MCALEQERRYKALTSGTTTIESCLNLNLTEHLNSEVGLGTITSLETAKAWLHNSFLFQRLKRNPAHYALGKGQNQTWEQRLDDLVAESVEDLRKSDLVKTTENGVGHISALEATEYGEIMSRVCPFGFILLRRCLPGSLQYYIRYSTVSVNLEFRITN